MKWLANALVRGAYALGYDATISDRRRRDLPWGRSRIRAEDQYLGAGDREKLRARCMDLRRNNAIVAGVVERFSDNVVGAGILPQAKTSDPAWNEAAEAFWREWSKVCDIRQRDDMRQFQRIAVQMRMLAGELGFVLLGNGQLQPVEPDRIATPAKLRDREDIIEGVQIDAGTGITLGYHVLPRKSDGLVDTSKDGEYIRREDMVFLRRPIRFDQIRGIPDLAPVCNALVDFGDLNTSVLNKAKLDAMLAWFVPRAGGIAQLGPRTGGETPGNVQSEKIEDLSIMYGKTGDGAPVSFASNTPNPQYVAYSQHILRMIGSALCIPYEFLLLDFSQGSFASSRAALLQTHKTFTGWQAWVAGPQAWQRIWNWRIAKAIKARDLPPAPVVNGVSEWWKVQWSFPEFDWVNPQEQQQADLMAFQLGSQSLSEIVRRRGRDAEDVLREKGEDYATAQRIADELNARHPNLGMTAERLISAQIPGQTVAPKAGESAKPNQRKEGE